MAKTLIRARSGTPDQAASSLLWMEADLQPVIGEAAWRLWTCPFTPPAGRLRLSVRATDGTGDVQPATRRGNFPNGAQGWHTVDVSAA